MNYYKLVTFLFTVPLLIVLGVTLSNWGAPSWYSYTHSLCMA